MPTVVITRTLTETRARVVTRGIQGPGGSVEGDLIEAGTEIHLLQGAQTTTQEDPVRVGARAIPWASWPATYNGKNRVVTLVVVLDSSSEDTPPNAVVDLYDTGVVVTGSELSNSAAADKTLPTEFESEPLTVGTEAGNLRTDATTPPYVTLRRDGGTSDDAVTCSSAYLRITYEEA